MACLEANKERHMTAEEIYCWVKENGEFVGKATIYRKLATLEKQGVIQKFEGGDSACYQYVSQQEECKNHYHLRCVECNKLFHIESEQLDQLSSELKTQFDFCLDHGKSVLYGTCKKCAN